MSGKRYMDEFKIEAVKQVTERGHSVTDVAQRLGITTHSRYAWKLKFGRPDVVRQAELNKIAVRLDERPGRTLDLMSPADKLCEAIAATHRTCRSDLFSRFPMLLRYAYSNSNITQTGNTACIQAWCVVSVVAAPNMTQNPSNAA